MRENGEGDTFSKTRRVSAKCPLAVGGVGAEEGSWARFRAETWRPAINVKRTHTLFLQGRWQDPFGKDV